MIKAIDMVLTKTVTGSRRPDQDETTYPDIDLKFPKSRQGFTHANGEPYALDKPRNPAGE